MPEGKRSARRTLEQRRGGEGEQHERAHAESSFSAADPLTWSEWVRRAKLMEALVRLAQGHLVLRVALDPATVAIAL